MTTDKHRISTFDTDWEYFLMGIFSIVVVFISRRDLGIIFGFFDSSDCFSIRRIQGGQRVLGLGISALLRVVIGCCDDSEIYLGID